MLKFVKKHAWLFIIIFLLLLFPQSLTDQAKLNMRVIITGIGVDYIDNQYQITSQLVLPENGTQSGGISAHISYITATGQSISECVQNTSYKLGKFTELSHIEFILVGETMKEHNLASSLDYFFRNFKLKKSVMLLTCFGQAKDAIYKTSQLELGVALSLQKVYISHERSLNAVATTYIDFISNSNSVSGTSVIDTFIITTDDENSSSTNSASEGSEQSQGSSSQSSSSEASQGASSTSGNSSQSESEQINKSAKIKVNTPLIFFKNGLFSGKITDENAVWGYYFANKKSNNGNIFLTDFSYAEIANANINIRIDQMNKTHKVEFVSGKPIQVINIKIKEARIDEIAPINAANTTIYKYLKPDVQNAILEGAKDKIKNLINKTFTESQSQNFDIFKTADLCYKYHPEKWKNFIKNADNPNNYIQDVSVVVNVDFEQLS